MKGKSGSVRVNSLAPSGLSAMETHEKRLDQSSVLRVKRDTPPLIYSPYGEGLSLQESFDAHNEGAKRNKAAGKIALHAFVQFPTEVPLTPENEQRMLDEAVAFINASHGGRAVFRARLDRDEAGRHGVDVFYAPKYEKVTRRGKVVEDWISLSKFGKEMALARFGERQKKAKGPNSGLFEPVVDADGQPVMERCDSPYFQGQALQDLWTAHLREKMGLEWVERGNKKVGRDPDRLEPEEYKLAEDQKKLEIREQRLAAAEARTRKQRQRTAERLREVRAWERQLQVDENIAHAYQAVLEERAEELQAKEALAEAYQASLDEREVIEAERIEARGQSIMEFIQAFEAGEVSAVDTGKKNPDKLTFFRSRHVPDDRRNKLVQLWRTVPDPLRQALASITTTRKNALEFGRWEGIQAFNGLLAAWADKEAEPNPKNPGKGEWYVRRPVDEVRKGVLSGWAKVVGLAAERVVGVLNERLGAFVDDLEERKRAAQAVEIEDDWDDIPSLGM